MVWSRWVCGKGVVMVLAACFSATAVAGKAAASFGVVAAGSVPSGAQSVPQPAAVLATAIGRDVAVSWPTTTLSGGTPATAYSVRRYDANGVLSATLTDCATGGGTSCVDSNVPTGTYRYTVQAGLQSWRGPESAAGSDVVVSPQSLQITSSTTITTLPATVTGTVSNFLVGEVLTYRLDSITGTLLTGSPAVVTSSVSQSVTVTLPAGTSDAVHSIVVVGSLGSVAAASVRISIPPVLQSLQMFDIDRNGRVDRVLANFNEPLAGYSAGTAPWSVLNGPSAGTLSSVTVSGSTATLNLTEGSGAPDTTVGSLTIALAQNSAGIRDFNDNLASFAATAPADIAAPAATSVVLLDANTNGKVDRLTVTFSENLASYTAGTTPWSLTGTPSSGVLGSVSVSGRQAVVTLSEGAGAADTAVGAMTVTLVANATGIRDSTGNRSSFTARAPTDGAAPIPMAITDTNGANDGKFEPGDSITITFSEALRPASVPTTSNVTVKDPPGPSNDTLNLEGISSGARTLGANGYELSNNGSAVFASSPVTVSGFNSIVTITLSATCTGSGCSNLGTQATAGAFSFLAATALTDVAGNASTKTLSVTVRMC